MSNNNNNNNNNNGAPPIPQAPINQNPHHGRPGPVVQIPINIPRNLDGRPDYSRAPGLDLSNFVPVGNDNRKVTDLSPRSRLNTTQPPTEGIEGTLSFSGSNQKSPGDSSQTNKQEQQQGEDEEEDEDEDEEGDMIMTPSTSSSETQAQQATDILSSKIPPELIPDILDRAEYFAHETLASRDEETSVYDGTKTYLIAKIPEFPALERDTAGKGGDETEGGRRGRVRKVAFKFKSRDQGWSGYSRHYGTYRHCFSWLDVEVWRKRTGPPQEGDDEQGMYRVAESLLQRNKHAEGDATEHEVVWRWDEDKLADTDEERFEPGVLNERGELEECGWDKGGRLERNGEFVRLLRGGDEIRVLIKALYPGWRCIVECCQVECWWAV